MLYKIKSDYITFDTFNNYNNSKGNIKTYNFFK